MIGCVQQTHSALSLGEFASSAIVLLECVCGPFVVVAPDGETLAPLPHVKLLGIARAQHLQDQLRLEHALHVAARVRQSRGCFVRTAPAPSPTSSDP